MVAGAGKRSVIPLEYLLKRIIRRMLPGSVIRLLLRSGLGITPGLETREPNMAADRYAEALKAHDWGFEGKRVMVFGYGGTLGLGAEILMRDARHVVLLDPFANPDYRSRNSLQSAVEPFIRVENGQAVPDPNWITIAPEEIAEFAAENEPVDLVVSSSVYEHLSSPDSVTVDLARSTKSGGGHLHYIDLRDHFFKYPFEMLCHGEAAWNRLLNPPSNLNRLRLWDYQALFERHFGSVALEIVESDPRGFEAAQPRIRPEFMIGKLEIDAATRISIWGKELQR